MKNSLLALSSQYIFAIVMGSIFILCLMIYLLLTVIRYVKNRKFKKQLNIAYADENLKKMDYDNAEYEETSSNADEETVEEIEDESDVITSDSDTEKKKNTPKKVENKIVDED